MNAPIVLYARLRARAAWNALTRSGLPLPIAAGLALTGAATAVQFANILGDAMAGAHFASRAEFPGALGAVLSAFQLVFAFVVVGSVSIRMFDPRKAAELDVFAALPLRRVDRFLIQASDVALVPAGMILFVIAPAFTLAAIRGAFTPVAGVVLVVTSALVCFQPVPALIALYAFTLRATPASILRNRAFLFVGFVLAVLPLVPILSSLMGAWQARRPPSMILPAGWAAAAVRAAETGRVADAALLVGLVALVTFALCAAAYAAFDRIFLEHFDEVLAKIAVASPPEDSDVARGRVRARSALARGAGGLRLREALTRKEILALARDPALQLTLAALGASAATFSVLGGGTLGPLATGATAFLAVYMAASLGLASFSQEGRGLPVLAPLPLSAGEVLRAKLLVNTAFLALSGAAGGFFFGFSFSTPLRIVFAPLGAVFGMILAFPLGGLVTAMGALFPRRLQRTGRREISPLAMSFFTALSVLFYSSVMAALFAPLRLGASCLFLPPVVIAAWSFLAAALVSAAKKAVRRGRTEG